MPEKRREEKLEFTIERVTNREWEFYKKYHYLNETIPTGHYYEIKLKNKKVGFICIRRFTHPIAKDIMMISRLVVVPEFQGFGIGVKFMESVADLYKGQRIRIITSLKPFIISLQKNKNWKCMRFDRVSGGSSTVNIHSIYKKESTSHNRITATFEYRIK